jgi:hypothetical protein
MLEAAYDLTCSVFGTVTGGVPKNLYVIISARYWFDNPG